MMVAPSVRWRAGRGAMSLPNSRGTTGPRYRQTRPTETRAKDINEKANHESDRTKMSGMQRHRISYGGAASADDPQNLSSAVQGMRWQGTDNRDRQLRRPYSIMVPGRSFLSCSVS
jgi:hypothetical protein